MSGFSDGQDVPVLGALSFPQGAGQAVQSAEYRSSGVIFDIRPTVRDVIIELNIFWRQIHAPGQTVLSP